MDLELLIHNIHRLIDMGMTNEAISIQLSNFNCLCTTDLVAAVRSKYHSKVNENAGDGRTLLNESN